MAKLLIAGDFCPQARVAELFEQKIYNSVLEEVKKLTSQVDYSVVNLECPIATAGCKPILKRGPKLYCTEKVIGAILYAGFDCVTLANNHFRDYGDEACIETLEQLKKHSVATVGGGKDLLEAQKPLYTSVKDNCIAIINFCEHEFSIATDNRPGAAPLDLVNIYRQIELAKKKADFVIVVVHGGNEMYQMPTPRMQKTYRWLVEVGVDVVINHHQHCFTGYEDYNGKPIFYGLGNFCFDRPKEKNNIWNEGYMVELNLEKAAGISYRVIPYKQCEISNPTIRFLEGAEAEEFTKVYNKFSEIISSPSEVTREYEKYIDGILSNYLMEVEPYNTKPLLKSLRKRRLFPSFHSKKTLLYLYSILNCESHFDILRQSLTKKLDL